MYLFGPASHTAGQACMASPFKLEADMATLTKPPTLVSKLTSVMSHMTA